MSNPQINYKDFDKSFAETCFAEAPQIDINVQKRNNEYRERALRLVRDLPRLVTEKRRTNPDGPYIKVEKFYLKEQMYMKILMKELRKAGFKPLVTYNNEYRVNPAFQDYDTHLWISVKDSGVSECVIL